jgi:hypothetical protein
LLIYPQRLSGVGLILIGPTPDWLIQFLWNWVFVVPIAGGGPGKLKKAL